MINKIHKFVFGNCTDRDYVMAYIIAILIGVSIGEALIIFTL